MTRQRVYFAGRISKNDWRHRRVNGLRSALPAEEIASRVMPQFLPIHGSNAEYSGPFVVGDDHGCAHGDCTHGSMAEGCLVSTVGASVNEQRSAISARCYEGIKTANHIFVWIEDTEAFGTLVEMGIAVAFGKPIHLYAPIDFDTRELWFAEQMSMGRSFRRVESVDDALTDFLFRVDSRPTRLAA